MWSKIFFFLLFCFSFFVLATGDSPKGIDAKKKNSWQLGHILEALNLGHLLVDMNYIENEIWIMLWGGYLWSSKKVKSWDQVFLRILRWWQVIQMFFASIFFFTFTKFDKTILLSFLLTSKECGGGKKWRRIKVPLERLRY